MNNVLNILLTQLGDNRTDCPSATLRSDNDPYPYVVCKSECPKNKYSTQTMCT